MTSRGDIYRMNRPKKTCITKFKKNGYNYVEEKLIEVLENDSYSEEEK